MGIGSSIRQEFSLFDKSIKEKNSQCYKLFAHYNPNSFSFSIFNIENEEFLSLESYIFNNETQNLSSLISQFPVFQWSLSSKTINYFFKACTIIPNSLFDEKLKDKYLKMNNQIEEGEEILVDRLKHINAVVIYSIRKNDLNIFKKLKNITIKHSATIFLENVLEKSKHSANSQIFLDVSTKNFNIALVSNSKLIFYNNFEFDTKNDFLYYILNCYNTLELNSKEVPLRISGEFKKDEILNNLKMYIKKVNLEKRPNSFSYSHLFNSIPNHYFHKLFNQIKCE